MITTIGFEKATFGIYDEKDEKVTEKVEVNGKNKKGGTVEADISGLDAEAIKVFASNGPYYISKKVLAMLSKQSVSWNFHLN